MFRGLVSWLLALALALPAPAGALPWAPAGKKKGRTLRALIKQFKSYPDCIRDVSRRFPAELTFWIKNRDPVALVCRSRQAAASDDASICQRNLKDYVSRNQCRQFFAIYNGQVTACPRVGHPSRADGFCMALASRKPDLCLAAASKHRDLCLAMLTGKKHCARLPADRRARCENDVWTWRGVFKPDKPRLPAGFKSTLVMRATALSPGMALPPQAAMYRSPFMESGALIADRPGTGDWFIINRSFTPRESYRYAGRVPLTLDLKVPIPAGGTGTSGVGPPAQGVASVRVRGRTYALNRRFEAVSGAVTLSRLDRAQAGLIQGSFDLILTDGIDRLQLKGTFSTFVRELVPLTKVAAYVRTRTRRKRAPGPGTMTPGQVALQASKIRKIKDSLYHVDPGLRAEIANNTTRLTRSAAIGSPMPSRGRVGYTLHRVYRNNLLWLLGFRTRDVVLSINRRDLNSREDAFEAFVRLKRKNRIVVTVKRSGGEVKLTYLIRRVRGPARKTRKTRKTP